jgi:hypothetical protein
MDQTKLLMGEGNYSDAFIFPYVYNKTVEIEMGYQEQEPPFGGKQIDPTLVFRIPMVATIGKENRPTETSKSRYSSCIEIRRLFERTRQTIRKSCGRNAKTIK